MKTVLLTAVSAMVLGGCTSALDVSDKWGYRERMSQQQARTAASADSQPCETGYGSSECGAGPWRKPAQPVAVNE